MEQARSNVVSVNANSTTSKQAQAEQLLWTEKEGRGWKARAITSSDSHFLTSLEAELTERSRPINRKALIAILARLANAIGGDKASASWEMLFEDYAEDLEGISESHLREIVKAHRRDSNWFPKPAELITRWNGLRYAEAEKLRRARVLLGQEKPKAWEVA